MSSEKDGEVYQGKKAIDTVSLYRRAAIERQLSLGATDGLTESELAELVGLPGGEVRGIMESLLHRVQQDSVAISRTWAIRQTAELWGLYLRNEEQFKETNDPRYSAEARGCLEAIRKIWGVESPQRMQIAQYIKVDRGVMGGILGSLSDEELTVIEGIFRRNNLGTGSDGEGLPSPDRPGEDDGSDLGGSQAP